MTVYGYIGNDYSEATADQFQKINEYDCDVVYIEATGGDGLPKQQQLLDNLELTDTIIVISLTVFRRGFKELMNLLTEFAEKKIRLISIGDLLDTNELIVFFDSAKIIAKVVNEHQRLSTELKIKQIRAEGKSWGRPTIEVSKVERINWLYHSQGMSMREIANTCEVALGTVHKYLNVSKKAKYK